MGIHRCHAQKLLNAMGTQVRYHVRYPGRETNIKGCSTAGRTSLHTSNTSKTKTCRREGLALRDCSATGSMQSPWSQSHLLLRIKEQIENHIIPELGNFKLSLLTPCKVDELYRSWRRKRTSRTTPSVRASGLIQRLAKQPG